MKFRPTVTIAISFVFIVLMSTGILLYALPWSYFIGAIHIWSSIFFIIATVFHFKNNLKVYITHLQKKMGKKTLASCGIGFLVVVGGLMLGAPPFSTIMEISEELRTHDQPVTSEYTIVDLSGSEDRPKLNLFFKAGDAYVSEPQPLYLGITYQSIPQIAVWMETLDGQYIDTLYVTGKTSDSGFGETDTGPTRRPEALPYWSHSRGVQEADGYFAPAYKNSDLDAVSGATPKSDSLISLTSPRMGQYELLVEVNRSYDFNEYYSKDRFPDDTIYSGDGSSGQPSLIYSITVDSNKPGKYLLNLVGHGHHSGADGELYEDLENITTAKQILDFIVADVE